LVNIHLLLKMDRTESHREKKQKTKRDEGFSGRVTAMTKELAGLFGELHSSELKIPTSEGGADLKTVMRIGPQLDGEGFGLTEESERHAKSCSHRSPKEKKLAIKIEAGRKKRAQRGSR